MIDNTYPVHERFHTFQGEGCFMGAPAFFIRLFGCPVHCPWCDSAGTWHPEHIPKHINRLTPEVLAAEAVASGTNMVVITGGEPAIHDLGPLCAELHQLGFKVHIETSGAFPVRGRVDWMTLSPKRWKLPIKENVERANEFKFIIEEPSDIDYYTGIIHDLGYRETGSTLGGDEVEVPIWLHPEWSKIRPQNDYAVMEKKALLNAIALRAKNGGGIYRAGWQLHKLYNVDAADIRSRPLVPLGGDESKGF